MGTGMLARGSGRAINWLGQSVADASFVEAMALRLWHCGR